MARLMMQVDVDFAGEGIGQGDAEAIVDEWLRGAVGLMPCATLVSRELSLEARDIEAVTVEPVPARMPRLTLTLIRGGKQ